MQPDFPKERGRLEGVRLLSSVLNFYSGKMRWGVELHTILVSAVA